jgi:hypothetical protein
MNQQQTLHQTPPEPAGRESIWPRNPAPHAAVPLMPTGVSMTINITALPPEPALPPLPSPYGYADSGSNRCGRHCPSYWVKPFGLFTEEQMRAYALTAIHTYLQTRPE